MQKVLDCIMDIGEQMLVNGAEVHRVESSISRMCRAMGAARTDIFTITTSMIATVYTEDGQICTQTRRIKATGTDVEKIHRLNALSRKICSQKMTVEEIRAALEEAISCKTYPFWFECFAYALIAGSFTVFFGGTWIDGLVSLFVGALVRIVILLSERVIYNRIFSKFLSSFVATILAYAALRLNIVSEIDSVIIGNIMTLIPGIGLTNAFRDLFTGDSIAGLLRTIEAAITALAIAAGYILVAVFGGGVL